MKVLCYQPVIRHHSEFLYSTIETEFREDVPSFVVHSDESLREFRLIIQEEMSTNAPVWLPTRNLELKV